MVEANKEVLKAREEKLERMFLWEIRAFKRSGLFKKPCIYACPGQDVCSKKTREDPKFSNLDHLYSQCKPKVKAEVELSAACLIKFLKTALNTKPICKTIFLLHFFFCDVVFHYHSGRNILSFSV